MPQSGIPAGVAYQLIRDVRSLDATPRLNLASFVTTWMEPEAIKLIEESLDVNYVDTEEYPSSTEIQNRCVAMLAELFHAPCMFPAQRAGAGAGAQAPAADDDEEPLPRDGDGADGADDDSEAGDGDCGPRVEASRPDAVGTATVGSSEAIMLGALSMKKLWAARRRAEGKDASRPNLVMGSQTHVCWQKFCRYFDVEERVVKAEKGRYAPRADQLVALCDENTIGVASVLGSTFTGEFEDVAALDAAVERLNRETGWGVKIHVDAASGGFVAPFLYPDLAWDFRLRNVASINVSGHKYGLVFPGVGWVLWRDADHLSEELVFLEDYLGSVERSITLNFSKGASQIVAQYYQFLRLGKEGYAKVFRNLDVVRRRLTRAIRRLGHFEVVSPPVGVPVVAFRLLPYTSARTGEQHPRAYDEKAVADRLRMRGWVLPSYSLPPGCEDVKVLRVTIREDLSLSMADQLVDDLDNAVKWLDTHFILTQKQVRDIARDVLESTLPLTRSLSLNTQVLGLLDPQERERRTVKPC